MASTAAARAAFAAAWLLVGCQTGATPAPVADDRYEVCSAAAAVTALERARALLASGDDADALQPLREVLAACPEHVA